MQLTKAALKQIIKEELQKTLLSEYDNPYYEERRKRELRDAEINAKKRWDALMAARTPEEVERDKRISQKNDEEERLRKKDQEALYYIKYVFEAIEREQNLKGLTDIYFTYSDFTREAGPEFKKELIEAFKNSECYKNYNIYAQEFPCRKVPEDLKAQIFDIIKKYSPKRSQKGFVGSMARIFSEPNPYKGLGIGFSSQTKE